MPSSGVAGSANRRYGGDHQVVGSSGRVLAGRTKRRVTNSVTIGTDASGRAGTVMDGSSSSIPMKRQARAPCWLPGGHGVDDGR